MTEVAGIVAPVFALIIMGAVARGAKWLDPPGLRGLNNVTFYLGIPALLFGALVESASLQVLDVAVPFMAVCVAVFAIGVVVARRVLGASLAEASVLGLNACYGNTVTLGIPLVSAAFGPAGVAVLLPVIALHSVLLLPLATVLIEADGLAGARPGRAVRQTASGMVRNPVIMSLVAALLWRALGIPVPAPMHNLLAMLGAAAPPLALFTIGAGLPDLARQGSVRETGLATVLKLVVQPALVWLVCSAVHTPALPLAVAVLTAGSPTGANAFFLARRTGTLAAASAGTVVVATAFSIVTLSVILGALRP